MKQITLLLLLMCSVASFAQDEEDIVNRTAGVNELVKMVMERKKIDNYQTAYTLMKVNTSRFVNYTDEQKPVIKSLFDKQGDEFHTAFNKITAEQTEESGIELIKLLLQHEDEFRVVLSPEQLKTYLAYFDDPKYKEDTFFKVLFFSDKQYSNYKKEL